MRYNYLCYVLWLFIQHVNVIPSCIHGFKYWLWTMRQEVTSLATSRVKRPIMQHVGPLIQNNWQDALHKEMLPAWSGLYKFLQSKSLFCTFVISGCWKILICVTKTRIFSVEEHLGKNYLWMLFVLVALKCFILFIFVFAECWVESVQGWCTVYDARGRWEWGPGECVCWTWQCASLASNTHAGELAKYCPEISEGYVEFLEIVQNKHSRASYPYTKPMMWETTLWKGHCC